MTRAGWKVLCRPALALGYLIMALIATGPVLAADIVSATYTQPTTRYAHGVLGDDIEYGAILVSLSDGSSISIVLPETRVFEDLVPRLVDVDLDGAPEIVTVESSSTQGARLSIYDEDGLVAATPYIGRSNRWLAPIGAVDLDGDGLIEVAYIDRPHLAKTLRVWRYKDGDLTEVVAKSGFSNHRIGWDHIPGGIRSCDNGPEIIIATGNWSKIVSIQLGSDGTLTQRLIENYDGPESLNSALDCP